MNFRLELTSFYTNWKIIFSFLNKMEHVTKDVYRKKWNCNPLLLLTLQFLQWQRY